MFTVRDAVRNTGSAPVKLSPYGLISRTGTPHVGGYYILHEGLIGYLGGSLRRSNTPRSNPAKPLDYTSTGGWLGFTDKYWLTALVPPQDEAVKARFTHTVEDGVDRYQADYLGPEVTVPAGRHGASRRPGFSPAPRKSICSTPMRIRAFRMFDLAIDFGWFYFLTKPIFLTLQFFYGLLGQFRAGHPAADACASSCSSSRSPTNPIKR